MNQLISQINSKYPTWELPIGFASRLNLPQVNPPPKCESLLDLRILMVDDIQQVLCSFIPELNAACGQQAQFLLHQRENEEALAKKIIALSPSLLLLDGSLAGGLAGWEVLKVIFKYNAKMSCFGFSAEPRYEKYFSQAGALAFIHKRTSETAATIQDIARAWSELM